MLADEAQSLSSLIVIHKGEVYRQSRAVLRIALSLGGIWILLASPLFIIPNLLRDRMYAVVARHRYKLVGKSQICRVPTAKEAKLFLP